VLIDDSSLNDETSVIAIDIGGGTTKLAIITRRGEVRAWQSLVTAGESGTAFLGAVIEICRELQGGETAPIAGVSVAVAGFVSADGALEYNSNLPWLEKTPIAATIGDQLGLRVLVDADSNAACLAEYLMGDGQVSGRFLCLTGGTGLGVGMVAEGKLLRIAHGCMGDAGHVIVSPEGPICTCGGRGCAEALLSTASLGNRYSEILGHDGIDFRMLVEDARAGKSSACALLDEAGYWLGIAAASLASIFVPDRIAVAGGLSQAGDAFFSAAQSSFRGHGGRFPLSRASLVRASTGEHATLLGAAAGFFHPEVL
jgi:glucokinase